MKVGDIMAMSVKRAHPDDTLQEAALVMQERNVGALPVCDGTRFIGMVTDRDIVVRGVAQGCDCKSTHVRDVMTVDVICCCEEDDVDEAARLMRERQVRRLVVLDRQNVLVGIISLGDLAAASDDPSRVGEVVRAVTEPTVPL
jgi:CBS domain-containing protein